MPDKNIELITKFLDKSKIINVKKLKLEDIANLPTSNFKFLTDADASLFQELFKISTIGQFAELDPEQPFSILYTNEESQRKIEHILQADLEIEEKLEKAVTISCIIKRIQEESESYLSKEQKIVVIGLSNAGKTTILRKFGGQIGIKDLANLAPTKGVQRKEIVTSDMALILWDFGGQEEYRDVYLSNPEKYFLKVDLVIYVIDLQDSDNYEKSISYFKQILEVFNKLEENPYILIFIHKFDPDVKDDPEIILNVELIKDLVKDVFQETNRFEYDIYFSSIYSAIANEPKFSRYLKNTMQKTATLSDMKMEGMGIVLESTLNGIIRLSESVLSQYNELDRRIRTLEMRTPIDKGELKSPPTIEFTPEQTPSQRFEAIIRPERHVKSAI
ncbi:MAG: ADP-ribosylation factor-like protein, partial [Desulfobacterales bacterium]|nr:ADP-ribosylation factor-like protein [Desulfobacterales bacterium]